MASTPPLDPGTRPPDECTEDRGDSTGPTRLESALSGHRVALEDWRLLGRTGQRFIRTICVSVEVGNRALAELLASPAGRGCRPLAPELVDALESTARRRLRTRRALRALNRRFESGGETHLRRLTRENLRELLAQMAPVDTWSDAADPASLILAIDTILVGVLHRTSCEAVETMLDRKKLLPELGEFCRKQIRETEASLELTQPFLQRARTGGGDAAEAIESTFDRAVLPCVEMVRRLQRHFDCVALGLLPDEMVADVLDRIFELTARSNPTS